MRNSGELNDFLAFGLCLDMTTIGLVTAGLSTWWTTKQINDGGGGGGGISSNNRMAFSSDTLRVAAITNPQTIGESISSIFKMRG